MHPAEERLDIHLPLILSYSRQQMRGALAVLEDRPIINSTFRLIEDFFGPWDSDIASSLYRKLRRLAPHIYRLTPEHIMIHGKLDALGKNNVAVTSADPRIKQDFIAGKNAKFIHLAAVNMGNLHMEDIATVIIHEATHLALNTIDLIYPTSLSVEESGLFSPYSLSTLVSMGQREKKRMLENADSISRIVSLLHYSKSSNPEHKMMLRRYLKSGKDNLLNYHLRKPGLVPRISSPILNRKY